jgi:GT2 family glycosyltransferase
MSFPREIFMETGGFSTDLRDGYDVDFGFRALLRNVPLYFDRNLKSIHNDRISLRYYAGRQRAYTESKKRILQKHPELNGKVNFSEVRPSLPKRMLYALLRSPMIVRLLESGALKWITPRGLRYRLYGSTIASLSLKA